MGFFNFCKQSFGFEHNRQNSNHAACLTWAQCLAMYNLNLRLPTCTLGVPIFIFFIKQTTIQNEHQRARSKQPKVIGYMNIISFVLFCVQYTHSLVLL